MEQGDGGRPQSYRGNITTLHTFRRVSPLVPKRQCNMLRIGDVWIPKICVSPNHFIRLYIFGVEDLFQNGDHLLRAKHYGSRSHIISWKIRCNSKERWKFQQESTNEQIFSTFPFDVAPLRIVREGDQSEFLNLVIDNCFLIGSLSHLASQVQQNHNQNLQSMEIVRVCTSKINFFYAFEAQVKVVYYVNFHNRSVFGG